MSITTTYTCDKCGKAETRDRSKGAPEQYYQVSVVVKTYGSSYGSRTIDEMWCRMCVEKIHMLPDVEHKKLGEELPPKPTLDEMIRQVVREELGDA